MDFHLKQWRNQHESEQQHSAKIPKLLLEPHFQQQQQQQPEQPSGSALPLFVPEPNSKISNLSAFPEAASASTRFTRMGSYFSLSQWQELELQTLIFRYMLAGAAVPSELLQPIKKSLLHTPYFLQHYQPALFQTGYWGRAAMDPEPGRCRRTDGKKWRCSRDVVGGQKYCERHMHRGRNRSRKHVEIPTPTPTPTPTTANGCGNGGGSGNFTTNPIALPPTLSTASAATHFSLSGPSSSIRLIHHNQSGSSSESRTEKKDLFQPHKDVSENGKSDGHILRHFFDDWPRSSLQEPDSGGNNNNAIASPMNSATSLSISIPGNSSSDVSLKLSTGNIGDEPGHHQEYGQAVREQHPQLNWATGWAANHMASMGGPLAEALRSSNSHSSPTSVLHQLQRGTVSETSFVST